MTNLIILVVSILGMIIFTTTVTNIILIIIFAIPFTKKLEKAGLIKRSKINRNYFIMFFVLIIILLSTTLIFYTFFLDSYFISLIGGYILGMIGIITTIKKFGLNINNFSDYFERNKRYFSEDLVSTYYKDKNELLNFIIRKINKLS